MVNKKGQEFGFTSIVVLVVLVIAAILVIWGFSTNWWGLSGRIEAYTGGSALNEISAGCRSTCLPGMDSNVYCRSNLKVVNSLTKEQLASLKNNMANGACVPATGQCQEINVNEVYTKGDEQLNYKSSQAKVTCGTLGKAGLIDSCQYASC